MSNTLDNPPIDLQEYQRRAERAFGANDFKAILSDVRAIVGPANLPPTEEGRDAADALEALRNMGRPTPKQLAALENIIRKLRPVLLSDAGRLDDIDGRAAAFSPLWPAFAEALRPFIYSIGRIDSVSGTGVGTGFLVSDRALVTNRHVLDLLSNGTLELEKGQATINFGQEYGATDVNKPRGDIVGVIAVHPSMDVALLEVAGQSMTAQRQAIQISDQAVPPKGSGLAIIGYPSDDSRNPIFVNALFGGRFGVKRASIGEVTSISDISLFHDCTTMGGNSGSPVFSLDSQKVVGIHRNGYFLYQNEAVRAGELASFINSNI